VQYLNEYFTQKGVHLKTNSQVKGIGHAGDQTLIILQNNETIQVDAVVAGIGIQPNTDLAEGAGIAVEDGILVDANCRTNLPDIFAAGDVASFFTPALGERIRVEHEDNANRMGEVAGENMAGKDMPYDYLPYFYSDLFDLGYEALGILDAKLEILSDWQEPFRKGVLYYLADGRVRGVVLWNVWGKIDAARDLIASARNVRPKDLLGKIT
jgi:NADPH-dependent 2,4-dienoyl-CoA reductase/sulfur reductase-like enzyme